MHWNLFILPRLVAGVSLLAGLALAPTNSLAHAELILQIEAVTQQIQKEPGNAVLYVQRGELRRMHMEWDAALADFDRALSLDPSIKTIDLSKGRLMADGGWPLTARAFLDRFLDAQPNHAEAFTTRARVLTSLDLHLAAAEDFAAAIRLSPEPGPELFIERAQTLAALGADYHVKALEGLDEGVKKIGPLVTLQLLAVDLVLKQKQYDNAIARIDKIAARSPRKETWFARRGEILEQAGRPQDARAAYRSALAALNTLPPVRRNVPAMAQLEKRIRSQLDAIDAAYPPATQ